MGKGLVAFAPAEDRAELVDTLELTRLGPNTITDRERFGDEIAEVRARGFAIADQEHEAGIRAVGVPVLDSEGIAVAAISTAAPAYRMTVDQLVDTVPVLTAAARDLALRLPAR